MDDLILTLTLIRQNILVAMLACCWLVANSGASGEKPSQQLSSVELRAPVPSRAEAAKSHTSLPASSSNYHSTGDADDQRPVGGNGTWRTKKLERREGVEECLVEGGQC
jgi:hypothetical protein